MKNEYFRLRVPFRDRSRFRERYLIRFVRFAKGVMIEIAVIAVNDAHDRIARGIPSSSPGGVAR